MSLLSSEALGGSAIKWEVVRVAMETRRGKQEQTLLGETETLLRGHAAGCGLGEGVRAEAAPAARAGLGLS